MRILAGLRRYTLRYKATFLLAFTLSLMAAAVELMRPWPIKVVLDYVLRDRSPPSWLSALAEYLPGAGTPRGLLVVGYAVQVVARGRRVFEVLDSEEEVRERPGAVELGRSRGDVVFEGVTFGYHRPDSGIRPPRFSATSSSVRGPVRSPLS